MIVKENVKKSLQQCFSCRLDERGIALPTSLMALMLITLLGLILTTIGIVNTNITSNDLGSTEAFYLADSGIAHAIALIKNDGTTNFDNWLQAGDGTGCTGDELSATPPSPLASGDEITSTGSGGETFGGGRYEVSICDDHTYESSTTLAPDLPNTDANDDANDRVRVRSTGFGADGAELTIEVLLEKRDPLPALAIDGSLRIAGDPQILGTAGMLHVNGNLDIPGDPCLDGFASATGSVTIAGSVTTGSCPGGSGSDTRSGDPSMTIPAVDPADFRGSADYVLKANGNIEDGLGSVLCSAPCLNWDFQLSKIEWRTYDVPINSGTYYSEGSIVINHDLGSPGSPLSLSLFAEGHIEVPATPNLSPALTSGGTSYAMVAGYDLGLSGNPANPYSGLYYAGHQMQINGDPIITGQLIAKDLDDLLFNGDNLVPRIGGYMVISGDPTITYDATGALLPGGGDIECLAGVSWIRPGQSV